MNNSELRYVTHLVKKIDKLQEEIKEMRKTIREYNDLFLKQEKEIKELENDFYFENNGYCQEDKMKKIIILTIITSFLIAGCGQAKETEKRDFKPANEKVFGE